MPDPGVYVYPRIDSPLAGTIADILARQGQPYARAAVATGEAQARAQEIGGQAWAGAAQNIGQSIAQPLGQIAQRATDPRYQLAQQEVDANRRALAYQQTATHISQGLAGPNGEQPSPDVAGIAMTKAGIPVTVQKPILDSLTSMGNYHKEAIAEAGHIAYQLINNMPSTATADDRAHAAAAGLGAAQAQGIVTSEASQKVITALAQGADPKGLALGFMGASPSGRYKDVIQDETKPQSVGRGGLYIPGQGIVGAPPAPNPTAASLAVGAASGNTSARAALDALSKAEHPNPPAAKGLESKPVLLDGKPALVNFNPTTGQHTLPDGTDVSDRVKPVPPASVTMQGQLGWKLQQGTGPDGKPTWVRINERTGEVQPIASNQIRPKIGATLEARVASAQAVQQTGNDIIQKLSDPAYANVVGPAMGRFNSVRDWIGAPPPELSELAGLVESYSLANMGVHGMRSAQGAEKIKQLLDAKHTPASLISAIKGLQGFSTHFMENAGVKVPNGSSAPRIYYDMNGQPIPNPNQ